MASITLKNLRKCYGDAVVIKNVDFKIEDKEFLVLLGPSGCGKSTLLRMIAGLETITDGVLHIGDTVATKLDPGERDIAFVFQNYALYPHMTVRENLAFALENQEVATDKINERIEEACRILHLEDLLDRRPGDMSGGQRQRVAIGRAIVRNPKAFLMDEPLSNLDAKLRSKMRTELAKIHDALQTTFVYVTHDQVEAMTMATRIVVLDAGDVQQIGTPLEVYEKPVSRFVAGFIGSPTMNFIEGEIDKKGENFIADGVKIPSIPELKNRFERYAGKKLVIGVRAHHLLPSSEKESMFTGEVQVVEPFGNETFCYLKLGDEQLTVRLDSKEKPEKGKNFYLAATAENIYMFDPETNMTLY